MKSEEFDRAFDDGEDITSALCISAARRPGLELRRVNVDFPEWMIESLDREARIKGTPLTTQPATGRPSTSTCQPGGRRPGESHGQGLPGASR